MRACCFGAAEEWEMSRFWSPVVHTLDPYEPGEQPRIRDLLKLNTNENPYGPSPLALKAMEEAHDEYLRRYPDPASTGVLRYSNGERVHRQRFR